MNQKEQVSTHLKPLVAQHFTEFYPKIERVTDSDFEWVSKGDLSDFILALYGKIYFNLVNDDREGVCLFRLIGRGCISTDGRARFWDVVSATNFEEEKFVDIDNAFKHNGIFLQFDNSYVK